MPVTAVVGAQWGTMAKRLRAASIPLSNPWIEKRAHLVLPCHRLLDGVQEMSRLVSVGPERRPSLEMQLSPWLSGRLAR